MFDLCLHVMYLHNQDFITETFKFIGIIQSLKRTKKLKIATAFLSVHINI